MHPEKDKPYDREIAPSDRAIAPFDREIAKAIEALRMKLLHTKAGKPSQASPASELHAYSCRWAALSDHMRAEHDDFLGLKSDDHDSSAPTS